MTFFALGLLNITSSGSAIEVRPKVLLQRKSVLTFSGQSFIHSI